MCCSKSVPVPALRRAEQFISEHFNEPLSLMDLAHAARLPVRSLTRGFRDQFGASPMEYVRKRRLEAAHSVLESSDRDETTVASAAIGAGFKHLGRFSAAYFALYGKYPSETLARSRGRIMCCSKSVPVPALRRAEQFISEHFNEPLSLMDLAHAARLPVRSLTRGFRDQFGASPMEYVRKRRLEAAHSVLESSDRDETTVASAAIGAGFKHVRRFSAAYFALYGKYPSETLARSRR